jgi:two-component system OmpR family sensor kinase/two-component system sensor histidine kinase BaeS
MSRRISAPLAAMTKAARRVAAGDLSVKAPGSSIQEVDALARAFNSMAAGLQHADQLRRNMTADIAHELRTPLTIIKGKLEGILDGVYPGTPEHIAPVLEEAGLLERLIEDLRLLSLAEAGQLPLHREEVPVAELLDDVQRKFASPATAQQIAITVDAAADLPTVDIDPQRMQQVLGNLVANSLRHTPPGGQIDLGAIRHNGGVAITVHDTGRGITPDDLPHVFDRFWRADRARSRQGSGAGLGLAIARQLVEAHGGQIGAASAPGQGTTITIELPIDAAASPPVSTRMV